MRLRTLLPILFLSAAGSQLVAAAFRPPAVPLVTHDPYFSIWSETDHLADSNTKHWTGAVHSLVTLVRIDGKTYRLMGSGGDLRNVPALEQQSLHVLPTHTVYRFAGAGVDVGLTFFTPALPNDLDVLSRPATYLTWDVHSSDGASHQVEIYFDAGSQIVVNTPEEMVTWGRYKVGNLQVLRMGSRDQKMLQASGDNLRIEWGYLYAVAPSDAGQSETANVRKNTVNTFTRTGKLPDADELRNPQPYAQPTPVLAYTWNLGAVSATSVSRHIVLAYDDLYSVEYFHRRLRPYWRRNGAEASDLIRSALNEYAALNRKATDFDRALMDDLRKMGGEKYAELCALAYRQTLAAHKLVADIDGTPLYLSKENFSNGSIDTVDVTYPSAPFFLLLNPRLLEAQLRPVLDYASMPRWRFPFAPHDLGRYPLANGQQYGDGERSEEDQMPVEESGNMLLLVSAVTQAENDLQLATRYWPLLSKWADYLKQRGLDPENQLCTDDFAGHLAHNANLSVKAILALGAYGKLAGKLSHADIAAQYEKTAKQFATQWVQMAKDDDHFRLAFDRPQTWSQKYNLVWDHLLGLNLFPQEVISKELAFYKTHVNRYGLPLDNRAKYTKIDWLAWTASLSNTRAGFEELFAPAYGFADETPDRVPLSDWYDTVTGKQVGFQARSVVGGIYIRMLYDSAIWNKYAHASAQ